MPKRTPPTSYTVGRKTMSANYIQTPGNDGGGGSAVSPPGTNTAGVPVPTLSSVVDGGAGGLAANTYYYVITAVTAAGETTRSNELSITVGASRSVNLTWATLPTSVTGVRVYRGTAAGAENTLVGTFTKNTSNFIVGATVPSQVLRGLKNLNGLVARRFLVPNDDVYPRRKSAARMSVKRGTSTSSLNPKERGNL